MPRIFFILLFISTITFGQSVVPKSQLVNDKGFYTSFLDSFKDSHNNEYVAYFIKNDSMQNFEVKIQKYNNQDEEVFPNGGLTIFREPNKYFKIGLDSSIFNQYYAKIAVDSIENIHLFLTITDSLVSYFSVNKLNAYKIDKNGNFLWGLNGIEITNNEYFTFVRNLKITSNGNSHLVRTFEKNGPIDSEYTLLDINGNIISTYYMQDSVDLQTNDVYFQTSNYLFSENFGDEFYLTRVNFRNAERIKLVITKFNQNGYLSEIVQESSVDSVGVSKLRKIGSDLYFLNQSTGKYNLFKFQNGGFESSPTYILDEEPFHLIHFGNNLIYTHGVYNDDTIYLQKVNPLGTKLLKDKEVVISAGFSENVMFNFQILPQNDGSLSILHLAPYYINNGTLEYTNTNLTYIKIDSQNKITTTSQIFNRNNIADFQQFHCAFVDPKDNSINVYFSSINGFKINGENTLLRLNFYPELENCVNLCFPIWVKKNR